MFTPLRSSSRLRLSAYLLAGVGSVYVADQQFNASSLTRTARTFYNGAIIAADYKINFRENPPFANSIAELHARSAQRLYNTLRANGGLYQKIGQAIAMQSAVLPPQFQELFARMLDDGPQNDWEDVEKVLREDFGGHSSEEVFGNIEHTARASASIAQVHHATLPDGRRVAVKVQKKEISQQISWDLWAFKAVTFLYDYFFDIPLYPMADYMCQRFRLETDFLNEAQNAERCAASIAADNRLKNRIYVPLVDMNLTTKRVMTTEWIDGIRFSDKEAMKQHKVPVSHVLRAIIDVFSAQIFQWGDVHCDPHPGNIIVRPDPSHPSGPPQVVLLDHGLYINLSPSFRREYASFWKALLTFDNATLARIASSWGVADADAFASGTLMRPYTGGDKRTALAFSTAPSGETESARAFEMQRRMQKGFKDILANEQLFPRELMFLGRTIRILQGDNQYLGSPVNRIKIMGTWASRALVDDMELPVSQRVLNFLRHIVFRCVLLTSDAAFLASRVRQVLGLGHGMESDMEDAMRAIAKSSFGIELNHSPFDG